MEIVALVEELFVCSLGGSHASSKHKMSSCTCRKDFQRAFPATGTRLCVFGVWFPTNSRWGAGRRVSNECRKHTRGMDPKTISPGPENGPWKKYILNISMWASGIQWDVKTCLDMSRHPSPMMEALPSTVSAACGRRMGRSKYIRTRCVQRQETDCYMSGKTDWFDALCTDLLVVSHFLGFIPTI